MMDQFITLAEASEKEGWSEAKLLHMGSEGEITFFYRFSLVNTELGEINIQPTGRNSIPCNSQDKDYAIPLPLDAEKHISNEKFSAVNGPGANKIITLKLSDSMVLNVLNDVSIAITYGWLPNGTAFKVVKPEKGLPINKDGMLLPITSLLFIEQKRQSAEQKQIQTSLQESAPKLAELIEFQSLQNRVNDKTVGDLLRLGLQGKLRFFVTLKYVSISWGTMFNECFDPKHWLDIVEATSFEMSEFSIKEMLESREEPKIVRHVQVNCPDIICNSGSKKNILNNTDYQSRIKTNTDLWPELQKKIRDSEHVHLKKQQERTVYDLWIPVGDVENYEKDHISKNHEPGSVDNTPAAPNNVLPQSNPYKPLYNQEEDKGERLKGKPAIAGYLGCSVGTVKNLKKEKGFPFSMEGGITICYSDRIDTYMAKRKKKMQEKRQKNDSNSFCPIKRSFCPPLWNGSLEIVKAVHREEPIKRSKLVEMEEELESNIQNLFKDVGIPYNVQLNVDDIMVGEKIVDLAETINADLIFLGIKKRSKVGKMLFGSTAQYIILHSTCPVITFKEKKSTFNV